MTVRERLSPWVGQPVGAVRAHPKWLGQLRFLSVGGQLRNLGAHPAGQPAQEVRRGTPSQFGSGFATSGSSNYQISGSGTALTNSVREVFVAQFRVDALPAGVAYLFGTCTNYTSNPSLHGLYINASGNVGIAHRAAGSALVAVSVPRAHAVGDVVTAVGVSTAGNSRRIYLATGESAQSTSSSAATNPGHYFAGGHAYSGNYPLLTIGLLAHIDGVPGDESEFVRKLLANPYGELVEPRRIWVPVSAGTTTTISCGIGSAAAAGQAVAISLPLVVGAGIGTASAAGLAVAISTTTAIAAGIGQAAAAGHQATITVGSGTAIPCGSGTAVASGLAAAVGVGTGINCGVGAAAGAGHSVGIALRTVIAGSVGSASAQGHAAAIALRTVIAASVGAGTASGLAAAISTTTVIAAGVGQAASAGHQATITVGNGTAIPCGSGTAVANGLAAAIGVGTSISCGAGAAAAAGHVVGVVPRTMISGNVGNATAQGLQAGIVLHTQLTCGVGTASATGAWVDIDTGEPTVVLTPGARRAVIYPSLHRSVDAYPGA